MPLFALHSNSTKFPFPEVTKLGHLIYFLQVMKDISHPGFLYSQKKEKKTCLGFHPGAKTEL